MKIGGGEGDWRDSSNFKKLGSNLQQKGFMGIVQLHQQSDKHFPFSLSLPWSSNTQKLKFSSLSSSHITQELRS